MIVQVRAPMGAGKSTLVRRLLQEHRGERIEDRVWRCEGDLYVLGKYNLGGVSPGAGGDHIYGDESAELMRRYAALGHVLHEGARAAAQWPNETWLPDVLNLRPNLVWALLDTPFDVCIERIYGRRIERGRNVGKPLNVKSQEQNYRTIARYAARGAELGISVVTLNDEHAYEQLHDLLVYGGWACGCRPNRWDWSVLGAVA